MNERVQSPAKNKPVLVAEERVIKLAVRNPGENRAVHVQIACDPAAAIAL